ncbi:chemotaxis protein CheC [Clostridium sp. BJN0001]|uniref:chemotaxis protein CheC n=1 Tax=Clostridium sp. BJN0001 TaxID=2930219 RepID=UPI001FD26A13|nr:chemotaxis protein CheC [Clostridium sp. BJN0001]
MSKKELLYDILKELFNISVGKAADMLSEITKRKIILNVPNIDIFNTKDEEIKINDHLLKRLNGTLMISSISFEEKLTGKANLIFPIAKMRNFLNICLSEEEQFSQNDEFTDIDFDIIKEIGNIILNCIIGEIGNYLDIDLTYTLPEVKVFDNINFSNDIENNKYILLLYITFIIDDTEIEGAVIIDLTLNSLKELLKRIDKIEDGLYE